MDEDFIRNLLEQMGDWFNDEAQLQLARLDRKYYPYTHLFAPLQINGVCIKNRVVMGPMANFKMAEETGRPNDKMIQYLSERARGGAGLITSGLIPIGQA
jgi:2-enoate reductase